MNDPVINQKALIQFRTLIEQANNILIFSGAGISTESGIPDFRGPKGIWKTAQPIDFRDFIASEEMRRLSWRRKFSSALRMDTAMPNTGHLAVAKLVDSGKVSHIITQNVDGLHQKSGVADDKIIEIHGNANYASCLDCDKFYALEDIEKIFAQAETLPYCDDCGGIIKTATISFGQAMPIKAMQAAETACRNVDLFIVLGSSLVVYPAAALPQLAKDQGAQLVILNMQATELDSIFDLVLHYPIGATLSAAVNQ